MRPFSNIWKKVVSSWFNVRYVSVFMMVSKVGSWGVVSGANAEVRNWYVVGQLQVMSFQKVDMVVWMLQYRVLNWENFWDVGYWVLDITA